MTFLLIGFGIWGYAHPNQETANEFIDVQARSFSSFCSISGEIELATASTKLNRLVMQETNQG